MRKNVREQLVSQVELLFAGRFPEMLPRFDLPLAVQVGTSLTVLSGPKEFAAAMADYRNLLLDNAVTGLGVRLTAQELPRRGRFRVWADFDHRRSGGVDMSADQMIMYCRQDTDGFRVELLHVTRLAGSVETPEQHVRLA